jgi:hypothetical protein
MIWMGMGGLEQTDGCGMNRIEGEKKIGTEGEGRRRGYLIFLPL